MASTLSDRTVNLKVSKLKEQQGKWMQQRPLSMESSQRHSSKNVSNNQSIPIPKQRSHASSTSKQGKAIKKSDNVLMWSPKGVSGDLHDGFVIRHTPSSIDGSVHSRDFKKSSVSTNTNHKRSSDNKVLRPSSAKSEQSVSNRSKEPFMTRDFEKPFQKAKGPSPQGRFSITEPPQLDSHDECASASALPLDDYDCRLYGGKTKPSSSHSSSLSSLGATYLDNSNEASTKQSDGLNQHKCPSCNRLMFGDCHLPFIVFPCGHTFCYACISEASHCPECRCQIVSTQQNSALQAVIEQYQQQEKRKQLEKKEEEVRKYVAEYHSLRTRAEVLQGEAECVIDAMEATTRKLLESKQSIKNAGETKSLLKQQIRDLQESLAKQESKIDEENSRCRQLDSAYDSEKHKLNMIEKTLKTIHQSMEKVQFLVTSLSPTVQLE